MKNIITFVFFLLIGLMVFSCDREKEDPDATKLPTIKGEESKKSKVSISNKKKKSIKDIKSFHLQYYGELNCRGRDVAYLDLYNYSKSDVEKCRASGTKIVIAYFSSQWSSWYPDSGGDCLGHGPETCKDKFTEKMLGKDLPDWDGERFVNPWDYKVRKIMAERIELAQSKGYDGIDVDNTDFYHFDTGFNLTIDDSINYINFFIREANDRGMLFSLKNSMDLIDRIEQPDLFQNESCFRYHECKMYDRVSAKYPVFIIRYKRRCPKKLYPNSYTILKKKMNEKDKVCK